MYCCDWKVLAGPGILGAAWGLKREGGSRKSKQMLSSACYWPKDLEQSRA